MRFTFPARTDCWIYLFLISVTFAVYAPVAHYQFVNYDDYRVVRDNPHLANGLTWQAIAWAFTDSSQDWWHPLTWLSLLVDAQWFGMNPGPYHLTNVVLHAANACLVFAVLKQLTKAFWPCAFVAALFALHPLHVESVAWITERKDVLSMIFWMLTLSAYARYVRTPTIGRYFLTFVACTLGLMAKPMLVSIPGVMLLLDFWPLGRMGEGADRAARRRTFRRLVLEKIPFFALAMVSTVVTWIGQERISGLPSATEVPLGLRLANAVVSYAVYIGKTIWPVHLAVFYPLPKAIPAWEVIGSVVALLAVSGFVMRLSRRHPYLLVGWLWYLGTLLPVIGLVQVGSRAMADRFMYAPLIGIAIMAAWGIPELVARWPHRKSVVAAGAGCAVVACVVISSAQLRYWRDSVTLFQRAATVTRNNSLAHFNLGCALSEQRRSGEAISEYLAALQIEPSYARAQYNLEAELAAEAAGAGTASSPQSVGLRAGLAQAHNELAVILAGRGRTAEAAAHFGEAVRFAPENALAHFNLALALAAQKKTAEAAGEFREALRLNPDFPEARQGLRRALEETVPKAGPSPASTNANRIGPSSTVP